jgi:choline dehydrogenase-like flavoprotein
MNQFDAIIIGSGAGGSAAAYKLATAGLRVAVVEKGSELPRDSSTLDFDKVVHRGLFKSKEQWFDGRGRTFAPENTSTSAARPMVRRRAVALRPARVRCRCCASCLGWPIEYDELRPYYEEAESLLGIRTFDAEPDLSRILGRLRGNSSAWRSEALPLGPGERDSREPSGSESLRRFASVAGLKADGESAFLSKLRGNPNLKLLTGVPASNCSRERQSRRIVGVRHATAACFKPRPSCSRQCLHSPRLLSHYLGGSGLAQQLPSAVNVGRNLKCTC